MKSIDEIIKSKNVLFIPIFSMRDRQTNVYNLFADGNMSRIVSKIKSSDIESATVLIPEKVCNLDKIEEQVKDKNVNFKKCYGYKENAKQTREEVDDFLTFIDNNLEYDSYDVIISEPNFLTYELANRNVKLVYWCVASKTSTYEPWFVKEYAEIDKLIASKVDTAVLTNSQVEYLEGKSFVDKNFYDANKFDIKIIFFPFRLTDESYHVKEFVEIINNIRMCGFNNFRVLFTDPNNSGLIEEDEIFKKVSCDKELYISILKGKPIIPYFEDSNNVVHISIYEFMFYECEVIMFENENINFETANFIKNIYDTEEILKKYLRE